MIPTRPEAGNLQPLPQNARCVALIPARAGSKRVPGKNVRPLAGHPLMAYTICSALDSGVFDAVIVSTESDDVAKIARSYGGDVPFLRPPSMAGDSSPDIEWVSHCLNALAEQGRRYDFFSILRPTSPFRRPETIRRAWDAFRRDGRADSLRAVERCAQHPAKMWVVEGARMRPLMTNPDPAATPWHSTPYQSLPPIWAQNASLEIARSEAVLGGGTIAGTDIMPFFTEGLEGFDINSTEDWLLAEILSRQEPGALPTVRAPS